MVNAKKPLSVVLALVMALSALFAVGATSMIGASAAAGDVIYVEKPDSWSTVNCYVWGGNSGEAKGWPGEAMTLVSGNVYSYTMPGDQTKVIFNDGNGNQTGDGTAEYGTNNFFKLSGASGNPIGGTWSVYEGPTNPTSATNPTTPTPTNPTPTDPTPTNPPSGDVAYAYLNNTAGWSTSYVYYWCDGKENHAWPGVALTDVNGDGYYEAVIPAEYLSGTDRGVIFNNNSSQSANLSINAGESKLYNNSTKSWEAYDAGALKIKSLTTDVATPQYKGTDITISAVATSEESTDIQYRFSVSGPETAVLQAYSSTPSVLWTPTVAGTYTITVDVKDGAGNENSRSLTYVIKDDALEVNPVLKGITPTGGSTIKTGQSATVSVNATGGHIGTNLLFYKVAVTQQSTQKIVNGDVYYSLNTDYSFVPTEDGIYTVTVNVQNSKNAPASNTYQLYATSSAADLFIQSLKATADSVKVNNSVTFTATAAGGTQPYQYQFTVNGAVTQAYSASATYTYTPTAAGTYTVAVTAKDASGKTATKSIDVTAIEEQQYIQGDIDMNGEVQLLDAILAQKHSIQLLTLTPEQIAIGDMDGDGAIKLLDAVLIQKKALQIS